MPLKQSKIGFRGGPQLPVVPQTGLSQVAVRAVKLGLLSRAGMTVRVGLQGRRPHKVPPVAANLSLTLLSFHFSLFIHRNPRAHAHVQPLSHF